MRFRGANMKLNNDKHDERHQVELPEDKKSMAFCRCWKSKNFPMCDGSHRKYNEENNDKVGPIVVSKPYEK
jgi:CDGSH iron-sulfur domain-containing protein 2